MKKLAIILDSFCAKTKAEVESNKNFYFIPLKAIVDGKEYLDGVEMSNEKLMKIINEGKEVKTSQPSPATIGDLFKKLSGEYEAVIYLCVSSALSGTFQSATMLAQDYKNVFVLNNHLVGIEFFTLGNHLLKQAEHTAPSQLIAIAQTYIDASGPKYVIPRDINAFIRGGRLGKTVAFVLEKLKAIPIIALEDEEKLHKKMVKRSGSSAIDYSIEKMLKLVEDKGPVSFFICHTLDEKYALESKQKIEAQGFEVVYELTAPIINAHAGDGAHSIGFFKKLD